MVDAPTDRAVRLQRLQGRAVRQLHHVILPFWRQHGFTPDTHLPLGRLDGQHVSDVAAPVGAILTARLLWTFATVARLFDAPADARLARRAWQALAGPLTDPEHGGLFWSITASGQPGETHKHAYVQAFGLYGLAAHYRLTRDPLVLDQARSLFVLLEDRFRAPASGGYQEAFDRAWQPRADVRLSEVDADSPRSMNTHLHVLEACTALYQVDPTPTLHTSLAHLLDLFFGHILDSESGHLWPFFGEDWTPRHPHISFGHDIEAGWLLLEAATALQEVPRIEQARMVLLRLAHTTLDEGLGDDGGVCWQQDAQGNRDTDRHWWVQAEAAVGLLAAWQESGDPAFLDATERVWDFIDHVQTDTARGDWFGRVARDGIPYHTDDKINAWKCPYHNARACVETIARTRHLLAALER
jgi:mannobiose 2-epimerase